MSFFSLPTVFNCTALVAATTTTTTAASTTTTLLPDKNENITTTIAAASNETLNDSRSTSTESDVDLKSTTDVVLINNSTMPGNETTSDNAQKGNHTAESVKSEDSSLYGYAGEVVLICLTVLFLLLFIVMVVKYHMLKTRFGGYDVDPGQGRSNPGYEVQMSYRDEN